MNKLYLTLVIIILCCSCKKTACYKCTYRTFTHWSNADTAITGISEQVYCDMGKKQVRAMTDTGNYFKYITVYGVKGTRSVYFECDEE